MNDEEIRLALKNFKIILDSMQKRLKKGQGAYWFSFFENAKEQREKLS
jgi:hypothetical protein